MWENSTHKGGKPHTEHPDQETYTFQVRSADLAIASLAGAALCVEILTPIVVIGDKEEC